MLKISILIIDNNTDRSLFLEQAISSATLTHIESVVYRCPLDKAKVKLLEESADKLIVFAHRNDTFRFDTDTRQAVLNTLNGFSTELMGVLNGALVIVGYTGGDGGLDLADFRAEARTAGLCDVDKKWFCCNRAIKGQREEHNAISSILSWCSSPDINSASLPPILRHTYHVEYLLALFILCQGYLAQYAILSKNRRSDGGIDINNWADVGTALKAMGWVTDVEAKFVSDIASGLDLTPADSLPNVDYWLSPFGGEASSPNDKKAQKEGLRKGLKMECRSLREKVISKYNDKLQGCWSEDNLPTQIDSLVILIEKEDVSGDDFVCAVARAYLELNLLLEDL